MLFIGACQVKSKLLRINNVRTHLEMTDHVKMGVEMLAELQETDCRLPSLLSTEGSLSHKAQPDF